MFLVNIAGDLPDRWKFEFLAFDEFDDAIKFIEQCVNFVSHPDEEDDKIEIFELKNAQTPELICGFYGWHWTNPGVDLIELSSGKTLDESIQDWYDDENV